MFLLFPHAGVKHFLGPRKHTIFEPEAARVVVVRKFWLESKNHRRSGACQFRQSLPRGPTPLHEMLCLAALHLASDPAEPASALQPMDAAAAKKHHARHGHHDGKEDPMYSCHAVGRRALAQTVPDPEGRGPATN